jgi:hypothetical protein
MTSVDPRLPLHRRLAQGAMLDAQALLARTAGPVSPEILARAFVLPEHRQEFLAALQRLQQA